MSNETDDKGNPNFGALQRIIQPILNRGKTKQKDENPNTSRHIKVKLNDHDTRGPSELSHDRFSGLRANNTFRVFELWILGQRHSMLTYSEFMERPERLNEWYCDTFGLNETELHSETQNAVIEVEVRKAKEFMREELLKGKKL